MEGCRLWGGVPFRFYLTPQPLFFLPTLWVGGLAGGREREKGEGWEKKHWGPERELYTQSQDGKLAGVALGDMLLGNYSVENNTVQVASLFCQYFSINILESVKGERPCQEYLR